MAEELEPMLDGLGRVFGDVRPPAGGLLLEMLEAGPEGGDVVVVEVVDVGPGEGHSRGSLEGLEGLPGSARATSMIWSVSPEPPGLLKVTRAV